MGYSPDVAGRRLDYVLREFVDHYQRPGRTRGLGQRIPDALGEARVSFSGPAVRCDRLGGLIINTAGLRDGGDGARFTQTLARRA